MSERQKILHNRARCKICGDIIESTSRHDFRTCSCGNLSVDGGKDYFRRGFSNGKDSYENLNVVLDITGAELKPGKPEECQGNGKHEGYACCCDECDYPAVCYPYYGYSPNEWNSLSEEEQAEVRYRNSPESLLEWRLE